MLLRFFSRPLAGPIAALLSGVLVTLSLAPFSYWPLVVIAICTLYLALDLTSLRRFYLIALCYSLGLFLSGASWVYVSIHEFGYQTPLVAGLLTLLFCFFLALVNATIWLLYFYLKPGLINSSSFKFLAFASVAVLTESTRSWLFTGFPWLFAGYSQTTSILSGWAPIIGVYGISFLLYLSGAITATLARGSLATGTFNQHLFRMPIIAGSTLLAWLFAPVLKDIDWTIAEDEYLHATLVQTNISQHEKWLPDNFLPSLNLYQTMSEQGWKDSELVIWPEAAIPKEYHAARPFINRMDRLAKRHNSALLTGIPYRDQQTDATHNSIVVLGNGSGLYHKQRLVPFGEYTPLTWLFGPLASIFDLPLSSMSKGDQDQPPLSIQSWTTSPLICYEVVYPLLAAKAAEQSDVLITISNDSWFGRSIGPLQHLQMAQMRALENGRFMVRATGNGVSAIISPKGEVIAKTRQFEADVLQGRVQQMSGKTPWTAWGYKILPALQLLLFAVLGAVTFSLLKRPPP